MSLAGYFRVCRPTIIVFSALAPLGLLSWSGNISLFPKSFLIFLTIFTGSLGWTVFNEIHDLPADRINKPWKPLPSGAVSPEAASKIVELFFIASITTNIILSTFDPIYLVGFIGQVLAFIYNGLVRDFKGNLCLSLAYGVAAFLCLYPKNLMFVPSYFFLILAHNAIVQYQDLIADRAAGVKTLPQELGKSGTSSLVALCSILGALLFYSSFPNVISILFFVAATLTVGASSYTIWIQHEDAIRVIETHVRKFSRLFQLLGYATMLVGA